ncbi:MAG: hypothetical protein PHS44_07075 [Candidatus Dojkabacteria bacterium]|nr:hypothetical protein [Candidatus Dojkabacteria bacterium]
MVEAPSATVDLSERLILNFAGLDGVGVRAAPILYEIICLMEPASESYTVDHMDRRLIEYLYKLYDETKTVRGNLREWKDRAANCMLEAHGGDYYTWKRTVGNIINPVLRAIKYGTFDRIVKRLGYADLTRGRSV